MVQPAQASPDGLESESKEIERRDALPCTGNRAIVIAALVLGGLGFLGIRGGVPPQLARLNR